MVLAYRINYRLNKQNSINGNYKEVYFLNNNLRCDSLTCVHNMDQLCDAAKIEVANSNNVANCETYADKGITNMASEMGNMNVSGKLSDLFTSGQTMDPKVKCIVDKCAHNQSHECFANYLKIADMSSSYADEAECETFTSR